MTKPSLYMTCLLISIFDRRRNVLFERRVDNDRALVLSTLKH